MMWQPFLEALSRKLGEQATATWFRPLTVTHSSSAGVLNIAAPNNVVKEWILTNYSEALDECLAELALAHYRVEWFVPPSAERRQSTPLGPASNEQANHDTKDTAFDLPTDTSAAHPAKQIPHNSTPLRNSKYTFESFVVGSCNRFAHAAATAVADAPGRTYNPLYIYGSVGLGKTHLVQAIGQAIQRANPKLGVAYVSLERFMNELINAIRYGYDKTQEFRERYRTIDVLLIDDIQFIAGKERTQEEFFHTFNSLYELQKQIVLTSDCSPRDIPEIEERLHSRFEWGLIADLEPPDMETKVAILKRKAEAQQIELPDDVALFLASTSKHNIRELEGSLVRLLAIASLRGLPVSKALAQETIGKISRRDEDSNISISRIQNVVAAQYNVKVENLTARSHVRQILLPRQVAMYLCKRLTGSSYPEIGRQFGGKHHTTVIHSVEKIDRSLASDPHLRKTVNRISDILESGTQSFHTN